ncbi:Uncharacterized protein GBIM_13855 [Gryllus bimaculatus]|nr:Uncharacterized protein GBIM_13855 [Gryllus bimaculatus]
MREPGCPYVTDKGQLRVQVEWGECFLLFQATYHKYDDVCRIHNYQMRREIGALQAENYSLERQLFSYQKSIAYAHSRGAYSDDLATPDGRGDDDDEPYFDERAYSLGNSPPVTQPPRGPPAVAPLQRAQPRSPRHASRSPSSPRSTPRSVTPAPLSRTATRDPCVERAPPARPRSRAPTSKLRRPTTWKLTDHARGRRQRVV